jgi:hypothetical protein
LIKVAEVSGTIIAIFNQLTRLKTQEDFIKDRKTCQYFHFSVASYDSSLRAGELLVILFPKHSGNELDLVGFEVLIAVTIKSITFWDVTLCSPADVQ